MVTPEPITAQENRVHWLDKAVMCSTSEAGREHLLPRNHVSSQREQEEWVLGDNPMPIRFTPSSVCLINSSAVVLRHWWSFSCILFHYLYPQEKSLGPEIVCSSYLGLKLARSDDCCPIKFCWSELHVSKKLFSYFQIPEGSCYVVFCTLINPFPVSKANRSRINSSHVL